MKTKLKAGLSSFLITVSEAVGVWIWAVGLGSNCLIVYQDIARGIERQRERERVRGRGGRKDDYRT
jgi:hypothetical protein